MLRQRTLRIYPQCHFFAGIRWMVKSLANCRMASRPPRCGREAAPASLSAAGKGRGQENQTKDTSGPAFAKRLIAECRPDVVFGEQG